MRQSHADKKVVVKYPTGGRRVRNVQSTFYPTPADMRPIRSINDWFELIRFETDAMYGADAALDATIAADTIVLKVNEIINVTR